MPTITQQYWTYFWKRVKDYSPILQTQALFLEASGGLRKWVGEGGYDSPMPGLREKMWREIPWSPNVSANHYYSRVMVNKNTMLAAFISFMRANSDETIDEFWTEWGGASSEADLAQGLFDFIEFLFFTNDNERGQSERDEIARKEMIIKLAEEWLYNSPMSRKQGVDVIMSPGGYSPLADDPSDFTMGQLMIEMSNPGGEGGSPSEAYGHGYTGDEGDPEFVVILDEESPHIEKVFESVLETDIWGRDQTQAELEIGEQDPHTLDSLVDTCCGIPLMLYMMILFLDEIGFNQKIGSSLGTSFPEPDISKELRWTNLMNLFEDGHLWKSVINRREADPQP